MKITNSRCEGANVRCFYFVTCSLILARSVTSFGPITFYFTLIYESFSVVLELFIKVTLSNDQ